MAWRGRQEFPWARRAELTQLVLRGRRMDVHPDGHELHRVALAETIGRVLGELYQIHEEARHRPCAATSARRAPGRRKQRVAREQRRIEHCRTHMTRDEALALHSPKGTIFDSQSRARPTIARRPGPER